MLHVSAAGPHLAHGMSNEPLLEHLAQDNQFDIDFLLLRRGNTGMWCSSDQERRQRHTRRTVLRPVERTAPRRADVCYELEWGKSLIDFTPNYPPPTRSRRHHQEWDRESNRAITKRVPLSVWTYRQFDCNRSQANG